MTSLPDRTEKSLGLVIDLDTCVDCKEWNTGEGTFGPAGVSRRHRGP